MRITKCFQLKAAATKSSIASSSQWGMWAHVSKCFWTLLLLAARGKRSAPYHRHTWNHHKKYFQGQECKITWEGVTLGVSTPVTGNPRCCSIRWLRSLILVIIIGHMIIIVTINEILFVIIVTINEILVIILVAMNYHQIVIVTITLNILILIITTTFVFIIATWWRSSYCRPGGRSRRRRGRWRDSPTACGSPLDLIVKRMKPQHKHIWDGEDTSH